MNANGELQSGPRTDPNIEHITEFSDAKIAGAVTTVLAWSAELDAEHVRARVENGLVTLEGSVARPTERRAAERLARQIRGVRGVSNRIQVAGKPQEPSPRASVGYGHPAGWLPVDEEC